MLDIVFMKRDDSRDPPARDRDEWRRLWRPLTSR
ncbi:hypothetical protein V3C99_012532 [Haemonchus contortus]